MSYTALLVTESAKSLRCTVSRRRGAALQTPLCALGGEAAISPHKPLASSKGEGEGHVEVARLLLEAGAAVNQAPNHGVTPLLIACEKGHVECARLLLEAP